MPNVYCLHCLSANLAERATCFSCGLPLPLNLLSTRPESNTRDDHIAFENLHDRVDYLEERVVSLSRTIEDLLELLHEIPEKYHSEGNKVAGLNEIIDSGETEADAIDSFWNDNISGYLRFIENREGFHRKSDLIKRLFRGSNTEKFVNLLDRSQILFYSGQTHKAIRMLERALRMSNDNYELLAFIGEKYFLIRQPEKAAELFKHVLELKPQYNRAALMAGIFTMISGNYSEAKSILESCRKENSENLLYLLAMATLEFHDENYKSVVRHISYANGIAETAYGHILCAECYSRSGRPKKAIVEFENALFFLPDDKRLLMRLASHYINLGFIKRAHKVIKHVSHLNPKDKFVRALSKKRTKPEMLELVENNEELSSSAILISSVSELIIKEIER